MSMRLEKYTEADVSLYALLVYNEQTMGMNYGRVFTEEEAGFLFGIILEQNGAEDGLGYYKVFVGEEYIGLGALTRSEVEDAWEVEYMLLPQHWRRGYGTELVQTLVGMAAEDETVSKLRAITDPQNIGSQKVLRNNGFKLVKQYLNDEGDPVTLYERAI